MPRFLVADPVTIAAVNSVLSSIGDAPVDNFEDSENVNVLMAVSELEDAIEEVQGGGFSFNLLESYTLTPDSNLNKIPWSPLYLRVQSADGSQLFIQRDGYLYDVVAQTSTFTSSITATVILRLPLASMPLPAQTYIKYLAGERFAEKALGDPNTVQAAQGKTAKAWNDLQHYETESNHYNILNNEDILKIARA